MPASDFHANAFLNTYRGTSMAGFSPRLGLSVGDIRSGGVEVVGGNYGRQNIIFGAPSNRMILNTNLVQFAAPSATWGAPLTHAFIADAMSAGNVRDSFLLAGTDEQRTIGVGSEPPSFGPGTIAVHLDQGL